MFHPLLADLLEERGPGQIHITSELQLTRGALFADIVVMRRGEASTEKPRVLLGLWDWIAHWAVLELKTPSRPLRAGELRKLYAYGVWLSHLRHNEIPRVDDIVVILLVPTRTPTLDDELASMSMQMVAQGTGYYELRGPSSQLGYVVLLTEAADAEQDGLLSLFARGRVEGADAVQWFTAHARQWMSRIPQQQWSTDQEFLTAFTEAVGVERLLAGLAPEQRLAGLTPEQRLAGLDAAHAVLALPVEVLRVLPTDYIATLPQDVRDEVRRRLRG